MIGDLIIIRDPTGTFPLANTVNMSSDGTWVTQDQERGEPIRYLEVAIRVAALDTNVKHKGSCLSYLVTSSGKHSEIGWAWTSYLDGMNNIQTSIETLESVK